MDVIRLQELLLLVMYEDKNNPIRGILVSLIKRVVHLGGGIKKEEAIFSHACCVSFIVWFVLLFY